MMSSSPQAPRWACSFPIPLASRQEREHALKALDEEYEAAELRIALWRDKSGWAKARVTAGV